MATQVATHFGKIKIGILEIPVAVLKDGTRVITQNGMVKAIGRSKPNSKAIQRSDDLPPFISSINLRPFIDERLQELLKPIPFIGKGMRSFGYRAELFPQVCEVYLKARDKKALSMQQENIAVMCDVIIRSIAAVGIVALVDEATGYQTVRDKDALAKILEMYISKELLPWTKRFPDDFYSNMFRLKNWGAFDLYKNKPQIVGKYTSDIVYDRIAPRLLEELKSNTPKDENGKLKASLHQKLTKGTGIPALDRHLAGVITVMKLSKDWDQFKHQLDIVFPKPKITKDEKES